MDVEQVELDYSLSSSTSVVVSFIRLRDLIFSRDLLIGQLLVNRQLGGWRRTMHRRTLSHLLEAMLDWFFYFLFFLHVLLTFPLTLLLLLFRSWNSPCRCGYLYGPSQD